MILGNLICHGAHDIDFFENLEERVGFWRERKKIKEIEIFRFI